MPEKPQEIIKATTEDVDVSQKPESFMRNQKLLASGNPQELKADKEDEAALSKIKDKIEGLKEATKYGITVETQTEISKKLIALGEEPLTENDLDDLDNYAQSIAQNVENREQRLKNIDPLMKAVKKGRAARLSEAKLIQEKGLDIKSYISKDKLKAYGYRFNAHPEDVKDAISDIFHSEFGEQLSGDDRILEADLMKKLEEYFNLTSPVHKKKEIIDTQSLEAELNDVKGYIYDKELLKDYGNKFNRSAEEISEAILFVFHKEFGDDLSGEDRISQPELLKKLEEYFKLANFMHENADEIESRIGNYQAEMRDSLEKIDFINGFNWGDKNEKNANDVAGRVASAIVANELTHGGKFNVEQRKTILSGVLSTLETAESTNDGSTPEVFDSYVNPQELAKVERTIPTLVASYIDMVVGEPKIKNQQKEKTTFSGSTKIVADPNMPGVGVHDHSNDNMGLPSMPKDYKVEPSAIAEAINKAAQNKQRGKVTDL